MTGVPHLEVFEMWIFPYRSLSMSGNEDLSQAGHPDDGVSLRRDLQLAHFARGAFQIEIVARAHVQRSFAFANVWLDKEA